MKFYESHYDEYIESSKKYNLHEELQPFIQALPSNIFQMGNIIVYGPSGSGKYTQVLNILEKYSASHLKYNKKINLQTEKQDYIYHISDIHYEIDMSLLGCNSKILWHENFLQIIDIISIKPEKVGFIVCKNFHMIHTELLEIFYSYIQEYSGCLNNQHNTGLGTSIEVNFPSIVIHFIIITENISFIPNNILNSCQVLNICKPEKEKYKKILEKKGVAENDNTPTVFDCVNENEIMNTKELYSFKLIENNEIPKDIFNVVCDNIIHEIINHTKIKFTVFRDIIYDILIYNLEPVECIWYILHFFIHNNYLENQNISDVLNQTYIFLKYYNNNYRPIYHLESILFYLITKIHAN
jgi:hypothetical protein